MKPMSVTIPVNVDNPYDVVIGRNLSKDVLQQVLRENTTKLLIVCAPHVSNYALECASQLEGLGYEVSTQILPDGEEAKTIDEMASLWDCAGKFRLGRADALIAIGGGASTDVDFIAVPTTLLGMVDASVGGKTGINTPVGKNLVGAFHSPRRVVVDLDRLETLNHDDYRAGLGEVVKCGFISDPQILSIVESNPEAVYDPRSEEITELIERSIAVKARVVSADLHESGPREFLNYGHTLAHAIEKIENFHYRHGEAVAIGCVFAAHLAWRRGMLSEAEVQRHVDDFSALGLPTFYKGASIDALLEVMLSDKKVRAGVLRFVLLDGVNHPVTVKVNPQEVFDCALSMGMRK